MTPRIASLVPSITELLVDLGLTPWIVARTGFCIHPREVVCTIPKVGGTKDVQLEKLERLAPTHVVVNVDENTRETVEALRRFVPEVVVTHPCDPRDNLALYAQMAEVFGAWGQVRARAAAWSEALHRELDRLEAQRWPERRVLYAIWRDPWMTVARDTYISRMLALVGWHTWPAVEGGPSGAARYPAFEFDERLVSQVDEVLLGSEPYRFTEAHVAEVSARLQALGSTARVRLIDAEMVSWYGSRAVRGLRYLADFAAR
ncbi:MAG: helical backbone metal receptor [Pseudomonadota bacterium]|uniref:Helical backbone metal receptor n=1 Tax=Caldimonas aquatica TaxID=376175 RepID=A0ABY6MSL3_9BURK|nr:helical backbone metal receptor [Schlegelella aquatica]UZD54999.1 helical backbone metal receptor [Schlegelella aquatica]